MANKIKFYGELKPEYKAFVMSYPDPVKKEKYSFRSSSIMIRPTTATYDDIKNQKNGQVITLDPVIFEIQDADDMSIAEAYLTATISGINVDFIEVTYSDEHYNHHISKIIDTHVDDVCTEAELCNFPRFYFVKNDKPKKYRLNYLVIDRFKDDMYLNKKVNFAKGEYLPECIIANFDGLETARKYCEWRNKFT